MAIQRPTVSPYAAAYTPTGILPLPPAPVAAPVVAPAAPVAPVAPPPKMAIPLLPPLPHDGDSQVEAMGPLDRSAANNWGYASDFERGLLSLALPYGAGGVIGAANNYEAMQMDRTGWGKQFSPSFFDVLTGGIFAGPGYDQAVLNMENRNIAGRPGFLNKSPFMDYTHSYGGFNDVDPYDPWDGVNHADPGSVAAAQAVEDIAASQAAAALASRDAVNIPPNLLSTVTGDFDFGGYGGGHVEEAPGEMGGGDSAGRFGAGIETYDDGFDHGMDYGGDFADDTMGGFDP